MACENDPPSRLADEHEQFDDLLYDYVDRLNAGEILDKQRIREEHPDYAEALIQKLEVFEGIGIAFGAEAPLGTLGDYTLRRQIGRGGMGVVYDAWQNSMDRRVALKVLPAGVAADGKAYSRFMREAHTAGKLNHPNVVAVYGSGQDGTTPYYAMEFVDGETLAQMLAKVKGAEDEAETPFGPKHRQDYFIRIGAAFAAVADGLQHAHSKKITHRDIKPSNLIVDGEGRLRILDFGLARLEGQESLTVSGDFVGTPLYMSPEQARARKIPIDHRTDVYSLGATMYEMLTCGPPFKGKDHQDTLSQIIERDPVEPRTLNQRVPRDLETIVLKCLRKDPGDRYGTAEALGQDLQRFVRGDPIEARPQPTWQKFGRKVWRVRWPAAVALLALVAVAAVSLLLGTAYYEERKRIAAEYSRTVEESARQLRLLDMLANVEAGLPDSLKPKHAMLRLDPGEVDSDYKEVTLREVVDNLAHAASMMPEKPEAHYHRAQAFFLLEDYAAALQTIEQILDRNAGFTPAGVLKAEVYEAQDDADAAKAALAAARSNANTRWDVLWLKAHEARAAGEWAKAADAYEAIIRLEEERGAPYLGFSMGVRLGKGYAHLNTSGEVERAVEEFAAARRAWPDALEPAILLARAWHEGGRRERSETILRELERRHPDRQIALWAVTLYSALRNHRAARGWVHRIEDPTSKMTRLARLYYTAREYEKAVAAAEKALEGETNAMKIKFLLSHQGISLVRLGKFRKAEMFYEKFRASYPRCPSVFLGLGLLRQQQGRYAEALELFEETLQRAPDSELPHKELAATYWLMDDFEAAERRYRKAILRNEAFEGLRVTFGQLLERRGDYLLGLKACGSSTRALSYIVKSKCLFGLGRLEEALTVAQEAADRFPEDAGAQNECALCLLELGRGEEAARHFRAAVDAGGRGVLAGPGWIRSLGFLGLGEVLEGKGDIEAAFQQYCETLHKNPGLREGYRSVIRLVKAKPEEQIVRGYDELIEFVESHLPDVPPRKRLKALKGLAMLWREHPRHSDARKAAAYEKQAVEACEGQRYSPLAGLAAMQFKDGDSSGAVRTLERGAQIPGAWVMARRTLHEYRKAALPDLPSLESIDKELTTIDTEVVIPHGATWRFLRGTETPPQGWTAVTFEDRGWELGPAGFGYPADDVATELPDMRDSYASLYLRHTFETERPERYQKLLFSAYIDDGVVVFLNGTLVRVWQAPPNPTSLTHETRATAEVTPSRQIADSRDVTMTPGLLPFGANITAEIDPSLLREGRNVLALLALNYSLSSPDFTVIPVLEAVTGPDRGNDQRLLENFRAVAKGKDAEVRIAYLEGRIHQRSEQHHEAVDAFLTLPEEELAHPLAIRRLVESLCDAGEPEKAIDRLEALLQETAWSDQGLLRLWARALLVDPRKSPEELLSRVEAVRPSAKEGDAASLLEDLAWALRGLKARGVVRINCGGREHSSTDGTTWGRDRFFLCGELFAAGKRTFGEDIKETHDDPLYQTLRWFPRYEERSPAYRIPLPPALYRVTLHFAELYLKDPGNRVFDVLVNGRLLWLCVDAGARGYAKAWKKSTEAIPIRNGFLELGFRSVRRRPAISAIEIERLK